jgi:hypothetical protein
MIEILYSIAGTVAVAAGSTQVRQLVRVGRSEEFSLATWAMWLCTQVISLVYTLTLGAVPLIVFNVLWVLLYGTIVILILYYRQYPRMTTILTPESVESSQAA